MYDSYTKEYIYQTIHYLFEHKSYQEENTFPICQNQNNMALESLSSVITVQYPLKIFQQATSVQVSSLIMSTKSEMYTINGLFSIDIYSKILLGCLKPF